MLEGKLNDGLEIFKFVARIVVLPVLDLARVHRTGFEKLADRIRQPNFAVFAGSEMLEHRKNVRGEDIATVGREVTRRFVKRGLFDHPFNLPYILLDVFGVHDPVARHVFLRYPDGGNDRITVLFKNFNALEGSRGLGVDKLIAPNCDKGLVADYGFGAKNRRAVAVRALLPYIDEVGETRRAFHFFKQFLFLLELKHLDKLKGVIEVILNRAFVPAGDDDDIGDPALHELLNDVLDDGFIDYRQHFLGHRLGLREKPGTEPSGGNHCFMNF